MTCPSLQPTLVSAGAVGAGLIWGKPLPQDGIEDRVYRSGMVPVNPDVTLASYEALCLGGPMQVAL